MKGGLWGNRAGDRGASNVVSFDQFRREQRKQRPTDKPTKPAV